MAIVNTEAYVSDHTEDAITQLLEQFSDKVLVHGWLTALIDRIQEIEDALDTIPSAREIDNATGITLDNLGTVVGEPRKGRADDLYRVYIKVRVIVNRSHGTASEMMTVVQLIAGQDPQDVWYQENDPKTIFIRGRNFADPYPDETAALLRLAKPAGTRLVYVYAADADDDNVFTLDIGPGLDVGKLAGAI